VVERRPSGEALVEVGGMGYRVFVPSGTLGALEPGATAFLFTHLHVREDAMVLFGFLTRDERDTFEALLVASGCPPGHSPSHLALDPVWARAEEAQIPVVFHVGGTGDLIEAGYFHNGLPIPPDFHGGEENFRSVDYMGIPGPPAQTLATMIFDGVLERFPELRIGVIEQGAIWVPSWMRQMESAFDAFVKHEERLRALSAPSYPPGKEWDEPLAAAAREGRFRVDAGVNGSVQVICATGFLQGFQRDRLLARLVEENGLETAEGWIVLAPDSTVPPLTDATRTLAIAGAPAQWAFPAADTLAGARYAAHHLLRRILACRTR